MSAQITEVPMLNALALAVAVYEHNGNEYLKSEEWDAGVSDIKRYSNRAIMRANLGWDFYTPGTGPSMVNVTQKHYDIADDIKEYTKKLLMKLLSDTHDYETQLYQAINQPTMKSNDIGFVVSAPVYYFNNKNKDEINSRLENTNNKHVGMVGGKVFLQDFEITRCMPSTKFNGWIVQGFNEDNFFMFFASGEKYKKFDYKFGDKVKITGKIKDHVLEKDKYPMTKLTWVQITGDKHET